MKTFIYIVSFFALVLLGKVSQAQVELSYEQYLEQVREHHPLAQTADLQIQFGEALLQRARGGFDPVIGGQLDRKDFDGKRYYDMLSGGLRIPTWLGVTVQGGYEENQGQFLDPSENTPQNGLVHLGVSVPIGQGLFIDERRASLRIAELARLRSLSERQLMLNDLLLEAGSAYWNWFAAHHTAMVYTEALDLAQERFEGVKEAALFGDRPYIDTLEAGIQVQNRLLSLQEARLNERNATAMMSVHLWLQGMIPMEIDPNTVPVDLEEIEVGGFDESILTRFDTLIASHPLITDQRLNISQLEVERRWKAEQMKPNLDLKYNALRESLASAELPGFNAQDYTIGISLSLPVLLRKERGALEMASLKLQENEFELNQKILDIRQKAQISLDIQNTTAQQAGLYRRTVNDTRSLLEGERELFLSGESSLFLVNNREVGYINTQIKEIELIVKNRLAALKSNYTLSTLDESL